MIDKYFLVQIKRTNGIYDKGVVVKDSEDAAKQGYHAYMGAYGYDRDANTDYVMARVLNPYGANVDGDIWERKTLPEEDS